MPVPQHLHLLLQHPINRRGTDLLLAHHGEPVVPLEHIPVRSASLLRGLLSPDDLGAEVVLFG